MLSRFTISVLFALIFNMEANAMEWGELRVTIEDIEYERGGDMSLYLFLADGFPKKHEKALRSYHFEINQSSHTLVIEVPDTLFAIKAHHDEDRSGAVTKNWTGFIPAEGFGFSSGARLRFGPPSFNKAAMSLPNSGETQLKMIYP